MRREYSSGKLETPLEGNWLIFLYTPGSLLSSHRMREEYMIGNEEIFSSGPMIVSWGRGEMAPFSLDTLFHY